MTIAAWDKANVLGLEPVVKEWVGNCNGSDLGIETTVESLLSSLHSLAVGRTSKLFVLWIGEFPVGFIGVSTGKSPLGDQMIANEHFWYVRESVRGPGSLRLMRAAEKWAVEMGCSHMIMNASNLASDLHDQVCDIYAKTGYSKFETAYIKEVK